MRRTSDNLHSRKQFCQANFQYGHTQALFHDDRRYLLDKLIEIPWKCRWYAAVEGAPFARAHCIGWKLQIVLLGDYQT